MFFGLRCFLVDMSVSDIVMVMVGECVVVIFCILVMNVVGLLLIFVVSVCFCVVF